MGMRGIHTSINDIRKQVFAEVAKLSYEYNGCLVCSFTTQMGYILEVTVGPAADDDAKLAASVILASIQSEE